MDLTGLACGAVYAVHDDGTVSLGAHAGFRDRDLLTDFFGHPDLLAQTLSLAAGRIMRLGSVGLDLARARSVRARAGLSFLLVVPMHNAGAPDGIVVLGAPPTSGRMPFRRTGHTERVSGYCRLLAMAAGMTFRESDLIGRAAALHDVGKLTIPEEILGKPGPLEPSERRFVERHAEYGRRILGGQPHPLCDLAAEIAWTHHERWDGTGYPRRLRGEEIPFAGRIAAIADVFDALTTDRPYRPAMGMRPAIELMAAGAGSHFDPRLLRLFVESLPRPQIPRSHNPAVAHARLAGAFA